MQPRPGPGPGPLPHKPPSARDVTKPLIRARDLLPALLEKRCDNLKCDSDGRKPTCFCLDPPPHTITATMSRDEGVARGEQASGVSASSLWHARDETPPKNSCKRLKCMGKGIGRKCYCADPPVRRDGAKRDEDLQNLARNLEELLETSERAVKESVNAAGRGDAFDKDEVAHQIPGARGLEKQKAALARYGLTTEQSSKAEERGFTVPTKLGEDASVAGRFVGLDPRGCQWICYQPGVTASCQCKWPPAVRGQADDESDATARAIEGAFEPEERDDEPVHRAALVSGELSELDGHQ
ncbi:hypothetical protein BDZ90DRAFT_27224 [Jaminaea rosea]|uniref:Uncharacterized protein n=1 Tax=Jaminaea rosea TaxID=1569628 RepID=A0A316V1L9_9BASI|nr:hypothetical protein BDZ90DRAFT_27224 [Jaminaea rosea]PWN30898.1 hypothetical protein BDZ90DRAFT_27224 [Jaminaea rosea]